jgi:predicted Ser/Thr protein kinase
MASDVPEPRAGEASSPSPRRIARFVVLRQLGGGGMGVVYEAWDPKLERRVALKLLPPEQRRPEARDRLVREAQALARLAHPNVVGVYDVDVEGELVWIAMEFVEGGTLRSWLSAGPRELDEVLAALRAAGEGLAAAHAVGLVHRDFKPDNVLVGSDGRVRVADFGLVRASDEATPDLPDVEGELAALAELRIGSSSRGSSRVPITRVGALIGTPGYMAPEQWRGRPADARADQFAFCVVLWEALYGQRPFEGLDLASLREAIVQGRVRPPPREVALPERVRAALARGLSPQPEQRFPDMPALLDALREPPARRRGAWWLVPALLLGGLAAWWSGAREADRCEPGREAAHSLWNDARRQSIAEHFVSEAPDYGEASFAQVDAAIDAWTQGWAQTYASTCETRDEQTSERYERRMDCLARRRLQVDTWLAGLEDADQDVIRELPERLAWLPDVSGCVALGGSESLVAVAPEQREAVAAVRDEIAALEARHELRSRPITSEELISLGARTHATGYLPAIAELERLEARLADHEGDHVRASERMRAAHEHALASGYDSLALTAAIELVSMDEGADHAQRLALGERWHAIARALSERLGHRDADALELHVALAGLRGDAARYEEALTELDAAADLVPRVHGADSLRASQIEQQRIANLEEIGRTAEARAGNERVLADLEARLGPEHPLLLDVLGVQANIAMLEGRYPDALRDGLRARRIAERSFGPLHARTRRNIDSIAVLYSLSGDHERARETLEELLERFGETDEIRTKAGVTSTMGLCATLLELEDVARARDVCPRAAASLERLFGRAYPAAAVARNNLALLERLAGDPELALALDHEALALCRATLDIQHIYVTYAYVGMAESLLQLGRGRAAYEPARLALALRGSSQDAGEVGEARCLMAQALGDREFGRAALAELRAAGNKQRQAKACATWLGE